jgi:hypothetical protein
MKKCILFLALAALVGGGVFGQTHFVSAELSLLGGGARYERVITPYLTIGGYLYYNYMPTPYIDRNFSTEHSIFGIGIAGRWYPAGRKFFMELDLGYVAFTTSWYNEYFSSWSGGSSSWDEKVSETFPGFSIAPGFGWTIDVGKAGGFFISPGIKIPISITSASGDMGLGEGIYPSVVIFFGLGYAF